MAIIFSRLASMPRSETMNLSSIPLGTPKTYFSRLSFMPFSQSFLKVFFEVDHELVNLFGLDYDVIHVIFDGLSVRSLKHLSIHHWYVAPVFFNLNGMLT
jgi:hypothetical protein